MDLQLKKSETDSENQAALAIRELVFTREQGISHELDVDEHEVEAVRFLAFVDGTPVGTMRVRWVSSERMKMERLAVLKEFRGKGIARALMFFAEHWARDQGAKEFYVHSQSHVKNFYEKLGYAPQVAEFTEAGITHVAMLKRVMA